MGEGVVVVVVSKGSGRKQRAVGEGARNGADPANSGRGRGDSESGGARRRVRGKGCGSAVRGWRRGKVCVCGGGRG